MNKKLKPMKATKIKDIPSPLKKKKVIVIRSKDSINKDKSIKRVLPWKRLWDYV